MSLDDAIRAAEEAAQRLREALEVLEREATAVLGHAPREVAWLREHVEHVTLGGVRRAVAKAKRPKGPAVTLEFTGRGHLPVVAEVIRRTATQALVLRPDWGSATSYRLDSGGPVKRGSADYLGYWRIREADLDTIRAMPVGENAVSRALKAIEAGRYDEVKP